MLQVNLDNPVRMAWTASSWCKACWLAARFHPIGAAPAAPATSIGELTTSAAQLREAVKGAEMRFGETAGDEAAEVTAA